jgi:hypothetical protein
MPPGQLRGAAEAKAAAAATPNPEQPMPTMCKGLTSLYWFLPLRKADEDTLTCFYQTSGAVSPLNQVRFLYGFGGGDSKTLAADLVSIQFLGGMQATLGSGVTMGSSTTSTSTTTITDANGQQKTTTSTLTTDSAATAISKLQNGGDFYVRLDYPLLYRNDKDDKFAGMIFGEGKEAGNFSGFGSEATITEASEYNFNLSLEGYGEWRATKNAGLFYADVRWGIQHVQPEFAQKLGLASTNFQLTQFAAGIEFAQLLRFGFQRFVGPSAAFGVTPKDLSKWHLVVQIVPKPKMKSQ